MKYPKPILSLLLLSALMLPACTDRDAATTRGQETDDRGLPVPTRTTGSVTGMPDKPRPKAPAPVTGQPPAEVPVIAEAEVDASNPETGLLPGGAEAPGIDAGNPASQADAAVEPTADDAVAVIRDYYASINSRSYARAYSLWSDNGRGSGQSPQQFADGFADTTSVAVELQTPGDIDAAAGSRFIEIPVAVKATHSHGSVHHYAGTYVLRRAVVDGASAEQRAWRIASADLREAKP